MMGAGNWVGGASGALAPGHGAAQARGGPSLPARRGASAGCLPGRPRRLHQLIALGLAGTSRGGVPLAPSPGASEGLVVRTESV